MKRVIIVAILVLMLIFPVAFGSAQGSIFIAHPHPLVADEQAFLIAQDGTYPYAKLFTTGFSGNAHLQKGYAELVYTANLLAPYGSHAAIEILNSSGHLLNESSGNAWYLRDYFNFTFSSDSGYVVLLFYNHTLQAQINVFEKAANTTVAYGELYFNETGLPQNYSWSVSYHVSSSSINSTLFSTNNSIKITLPLGTIVDYSLTAKNYSAIEGSHGTVTVRSLTVLNITFSKILRHGEYVVEFHESGLPVNTPWTVFFNFSYNTSISDNISFLVPNGSFSYSVPPILGYVSDPANGPVTIDGSNKVIDVTFGPNNNYSVNSIGVGVFPQGMIYDSINNTVWVTNQYSNSVSIISASSNAVIANILVGSLPNTVAWDSDNNTIYIADSGSNSVSVISAISNTLVANISVGQTPEGITYDPVNNEVYVASSESNTIYVISGNSNQVIKVITVGNYPDAAAYNPENNCVYVADSSGSVSVISGLSNSVVATIITGKYTYALAYDPLSNVVFAANANSNNVSVISCSDNSIIGSIDVGRNPTALAYDPTNNTLFVANDEFGVQVFSGASYTMIESLDIGSGPYDMVYDSNSNSIYVTDVNEDAIVVISAAT
jgi:YVTN family beta-propeller protein